MSTLPEHGFYSGDEWKRDQGRGPGGWSSGGGSSGGGSSGSYGSLAVVGVIVLLVCAVFYGAPAGPEQLPELPGALDEGTTTQDGRLSELLTRAADLLRKKELEEAEAVYREVLGLYPQDPDSHSNLGACCYFRADYEAAEEHYRSALALSPHDPRALYGLGCVCLAQGKFDQAKVALERALERGADRAQCVWSLASVADHTRDVRAARRYYAEYLQLSPAGEHREHARSRLVELGER